MTEPAAVYLRALNLVAADLVRLGEERDSLLKARDALLAILGKIPHQTFTPEQLIP